VHMSTEIAEDEGEFVDGVVDMLIDADMARARSGIQRQFVQQFSFDRSARELHTIVSAHLPAMGAERKAAE